MKKIFSIFFLVLSVICVIISVSKFLEQKNAGKEYEELRILAKKDVTETVTESEVLEPVEAGEDTELPKVTVTPTPVPTPKEEPSRVIVSYEDSLEIPVDFEALSEVNSDIYAWIEVEGTKVDYPIVQDKEDDTFYVDHSFERKSAVEGAIFTESYNHKDFEDPNTVIYGHNMKNGSMFQTLHSFSDRAFFNENRDVTVYMPDQIRHYEIFAAYVYDSRHILQTYDFSDEYIFKYYLNEITSMRDMNSFVDTSYGLKKNDKLLTLSTCYRGIAEKRFLVQAVLVSIEKKI